ncbi:immunoglobulin superfamily member 1-like [Colossoma macropomum]|uniref:immunoglobulin superfamily member 1-like n=1 Tax=Colossoma macropomum TaxID=42526 RepID=UPI0018654811|nr:immunoglobulin superfamily member 1-like [Colossoma macropomum]
MEFRSLSVILLLIAIIHSGQTENETFPQSYDYSAEPDKNNDGGSSNTWGESATQTTEHVSEKPKAVVSIQPDEQVFIGETVTLRCVIQGEGVSNWQYSWFKDDSSTPVSKEQQYSISSVTESHSGKYTCRGTERGTSRYSHTSDAVTLTVSDLPKPTLTVEPESPVFRGESVTLKCEINTYDGWTYQWYKQDTWSRWTAVSQSEYYTVNTDTLTIREDAVINGDQYQCRGERHNRPTSSQDSDSVTLTVKERPKAVLSIQPDEEVFIGETVTLRCVIQGEGVSNWQYRWFKDDSDTPVSNEQQYSISSVTESHRGKYTCRGTERGTSRYSHTSDAVTLTVSDLPKSTLTVKPESPVFSGESVTLKCEINTYDGWTYQWYEQDTWSRWTPVSRSVYYTVNRDSLTIREDAVINGDQYQCIGVRHYRPTLSQYSNSVTLTVKERPKAVLSIKPDEQVFIGETVTLRCVIQGEGVSNWQYSWFKDDSDTPVSNEQQYSISSVTESHRGKYTCRGTERGTSRYSHTSDAVTLTVSDLPKSTLTVKPESPVFSGESVTLKCEINTYDGWTYQWYEQDTWSRRTPVSRSVFYTVNKDTLTIREDAVINGDQYQCIGVRHYRPTLSQYSNSVTLTVKERPKAVLSIQPDEQVFIGETVTLRCVIQGEGVSNWQYSWFKDDSDTPVSNEQQYSISSVTESHRGKYTCRGTERGTSRYSHTSDAVTLTVSDLPKSTLTVKPESPVFRGESVTLKCEIITYDGWTYQWYKQDTWSRWTPVSRSVYYTVNRDSLTIREDAVNNGDQYQCIGVRHYRPTSSQYSNSVTLTVKDKPKSTLTVKPESPVFRGESVTLKCEIITYDGWTYKWYKQDTWRRRTPVSRSVYYTVNRDSLTIREDAVNNGDQYQCIGVRHYRPTLSQYSNSVTLTVKDKPKSTLTVKPESPVFRGESVTLKCEIITYDGWTYKWYKQDTWRRRTPVSRSVYYTVNRDSLTIREDAVNNGDQYQCIGVRHYRPTLSQYSNSVTLTVKERPKAVLSIQPDEQVFIGETVTLRCVIQGEGVSNWQYSWFKDDSDTPVSNEQQYSISSVTESHRGKYTCRGTVRGTSRYSHTSDAVTLTVSDLPKSTLTVKPDSPVFRGESVTLKCEIITYDGWTYQWYKQDTWRRRTPVSRSVYYTVNKDTLTIREDAVNNGDQYQCIGVRHYRPTLSQYSNSVTLTVKALPRATLTVEPKWSPVFTGESVTLKCEIESYSNWRYQWYKGSSRTAVYQSQTNTFTIRSAADQDQYWCRGERDNRPSSQHSDTVTLTVEEELEVDVEEDDVVDEDESDHSESCMEEDGWLGMEEEEVGVGHAWCESCGHKSKKASSSPRRAEVQRGTHATPHSRRGSTILSDEWCAYWLALPQLGYRHYTVNHKKPKPELTSSHTGATVLGNPVFLYCELNQSAGWKFYWSKHTQNPENEIKTETHSYSISSVSVSDGGQYWCRAGRGNPVYYTNYSDALWMNTTGVSHPVSLVVSPSRTQHFITDSLSLSCEGQSNSTGWRVRRYTHSEKVSDCSSGWGSVTGSTCNISSLYTSHTGMYWCESESGESSNPVNITVHNGSVILESPVHPVTEGDPLTLRCLYRDPKPSNLTVEFYKNGSLLQTQTTGEMTIHTVSKSDEGLYHCKHPEKGESPQSWISVRRSNHVTVILVAVALSLTLFLIVMLCLICCCKKKKGNKKNTSQTSGQSQNTGSTLLQPGNDHVYGNVGVAANTTTDYFAAGSSDVTYAHVMSTKKKLRTNDDSVAGSNDTTYAQVMSTKKKPKRKDDSAAGSSEATYVQVMSTKKKLKTNDDSATDSSDATYAQALSIKKKPKKKYVAVTPNDLTNSQIEMKHLKSHSEDDVMSGPSDTVYSQIQEKSKKPKGKGASKYSEAEPSDVTYAEIDLKDKRAKEKIRVKGKSSEEADSVYSELK